MDADPRTPFDEFEHVHKTKTEIEQMTADLSGHHIEGIAVMGNTPFKVPLISHVNGNLWQGGCRDGVKLPEAFRYVLSLYPWEEFTLPDGCERVDVAMYDSDEGPNTGLINGLADMVEAFCQHGPTLVHCQAGLNRSSLVVAAVLTRGGGLSSKDAIHMIRQKRSRACLCNPAFERWVERHA